ncbi:MAG: MotA/TolQ/ExbB proton channel family protein [Lentisphaeria bacterium]|nr:MotA/TolQ/ExbB proton channel family protein [Lentisphaeria bacterium]
MNFWVPLAAASPGVYYAFQHSDSVGKGIVLLLLISSSITWTVMVDKGLVLRRAKLLSRRFLYKFRAHQGSIASSTLCRERPEGPIGELYAAGVDKLNEFYENSSPLHDPWHREAGKLSEAQLSAIEAVLEREVSHQIEQLETRIGMLGTMVSLSPFLGLFGTVWGVMMAFCGIAVAGKPDFFALAPGVAGALLTTVAGLVVAIPSLVGYNMLNGSIRHLTNMMDNFTEEFMVRLKLEQLELEQTAQNNPKDE